MLSRSKARARVDSDDFITIDFPGGTDTQAWGINARGDIVGLYVGAGATHGFLLGRKGEFTSIDFPDAIATEAFGINSRGDIVGRYCSADGAFRAFLLSGKGKKTNLTSVTRH